MIVLKSPSELARMRRAGRIVARTLVYLRERIRPGISTVELDRLAEEFIRRAAGVPSFKGYRGYPASICVSINEELVHGIPGQRRLREGDIVTLDLGAIYQGYHSDAALTLGVGEISAEARRLLEATAGALSAGIQQARPGNRLGDISAAIQRYVEASGFSVVREYVGHGIGREMHEPPQVPNFGSPGQGPLLRPGMTLALEPMVNAGSPATRVREDRWTVVSEDGSWCAHFEHTIAIGEAEPEILTDLDLPDGV
ncbi:MAG: type I methionyl aminopeptidase [Chloroflexi bacterium]|nr:type I methionyl aminopeptidase [Chloroflexota bacterium]